MESNKVPSPQQVEEVEIEALLSELNRKRFKFFALMLGVIAGLPAGFYGARAIYQWLFPAT